MISRDQKMRLRVLAIEAAQDKCESIRTAAEIVLRTLTIEELPHQQKERLK